MWLLLACSAKEISLDAFQEYPPGVDTGLNAAVSDEDQGEFDSTEDIWWRPIADLRLSDRIVSESGSRLEIFFYDVEMAYLCVQPLTIVTVVEESAPFDEAMLWWRIHVKPTPITDWFSVSSDIHCEESHAVPDEFHLGVGQLHVESLAVWDSIYWDDLSSVGIEQAAEISSSYLSLDGGQSIWVYGVALSSMVSSSELSMEDWLSADQTWSLRPAYYLPNLD